MILALGTSKAAVLALGIIASASATVTLTPTCMKLEGLYQANIETVGTALQAFEQCTSAQTGRNACTTETHELVTAREELQAVFRDYLKTCSSRLARHGTAGETVVAVGGIGR